MAGARDKSWLLVGDSLWERASASLQPEHKLICAVLRQAAKDAAGMGYADCDDDGWDRRSAKVCARNWILNSKSCRWYCELIGVQSSDLMDAVNSRTSASR